MRWDEHKLKEKRARLAECDSPDQAGALIYQWVKEDRIGPVQMCSLIIELYKGTV